MRVLSPRSAALASEKENSSPLPPSAQHAGVDKTWYTSDGPIARGKGQRVLTAIKCPNGTSPSKVAVTATVGVFRSTKKSLYPGARGGHPPQAVSPVKITSAAIVHPASVSVQSSALKVEQERVAFNDGVPTFNDGIPASRIISQVLKNDASGHINDLVQDLTCKTIQVITSDEKVLALPTTIALRSHTLKWKFWLQRQQQETVNSNEQQKAPAGNQNPVLLTDPSCTHEMMTKVARYMGAVIAAETGNLTMSDLMQEEKELTDVDNQGLLNLLMVASHLDIPELTQIACERLNENAASGKDREAEEVVSQAASHELPASYVVWRQTWNRIADEDAIQISNNPESSAEQQQPRPDVDRSLPQEPVQEPEPLLSLTEQVLTDADMIRMLNRSHSPAAPAPAVPRNVEWEVVSHAIKAQAVQTREAGGGGAAGAAPKQAAAKGVCERKELTQTQTQTNNTHKNNADGSKPALAHSISTSTSDKENDAAHSSAAQHVPVVRGIAGPAPRLPFRAKSVSPPAPAPPLPLRGSGQAEQEREKERARREEESEAQQREAAALRAQLEQERERQEAATALRSLLNSTNQTLAQARLHLSSLDTDPPPSSSSSGPATLASRAALEHAEHVTALAPTLSSAPAPAPAPMLLPAHTAGAAHPQAEGVGRAGPGLTVAPAGSGLTVASQPPRPPSAIHTAPLHLDQGASASLQWHQGAPVPVPALHPRVGQKEGAEAGVRRAAGGGGLVRQSRAVHITAPATAAAPTSIVSERGAAPKASARESGAAPKANARESGAAPKGSEEKAGGGGEKVARKEGGEKAEGGGGAVAPAMRGVGIFVAENGAGWWGEVEGEQEVKCIFDEEGGRYVGTCIGTVKHGKGVCWYANGDKYCGEWRNGLRHGQGRMDWTDGSSFEGLWRHDLVCPGIICKPKPKPSVFEAPSPHPMGHLWPALSDDMDKVNAQRQLPASPPPPNQPRVPSNADSLREVASFQASTLQARADGRRAGGAGGGNVFTGIMTDMFGLADGVGSLVHHMVAGSPVELETPKGVRRMEEREAGRVGMGERERFAFHHHGLRRPGPAARDSEYPEPTELLL